ncbi:SPOR domain-containing protein [Azospirillum sp. TSA6c]|uniref:SPOR domain-containing protein n=1 Tax=unclassified Azospirillum TaxID=2630922 RepID=UPI001FFF46A3|nr:SPOR domain-containing protein [Azospirillum sp. TSA6c]
MTTITLGRGQVAGLAIGVVVLMVVAVLLGVGIAVATMGPVPATQVAAGPIVATAGAAPAAAPAGEGRFAGVADTVGMSAISRRFETEQAVKATADRAADTVSGVTESVLDPVAHGTLAAAGRFLPSWMAAPMAKSVNRASFQARSKLSYGVENSVEERLFNGLDQVSGQGQGGQGAKAGDPAPVRSFAVELGRFANQANAESFADAAGQRGVSAAVSYAPDGGATTPYAVRSGRFATTDEATAAADAIKRSSGVAGTVVTLAEPGGRS